MTQPKLSLGQAIDQIITAFEGVDADARATVLETVRAHLKISTPQFHPGAAPDHKPLESNIPKTGKADSAAAKPPTAAVTDIRSLRATKNPRSAKEMACVVAFYLQELAPEGERKEAVSAADLEKYFKQAQFKLPEKISQVLPDAKGSGYFDTASRGSYKLNAVGYNLVAHKLPASTAGG